VTSCAASLLWGAWLFCIMLVYPLCCTSLTLESCVMLVSCCVTVSCWCCVMLVSCWCHVGVMLVSCCVMLCHSVTLVLYHVGVVSCWYCVMLVSCWCHVYVMLVLCHVVSRCHVAVALCWCCVMSVSCRCHVGVMLCHVGVVLLPRGEDLRSVCGLLNCSCTRIGHKGYLHFIFLQSHAHSIPTP
jgi:hypothetical protein